MNEKDEEDLQKDDKEVNDYDDYQGLNKENYDDSTCSLLAAPRMGAASFLYS